MIRALSVDISQSWISLQIQDHVWVVPAVQSVHILAISALIFASLSANVALLRDPMGARATAWIAESYRWTWVSLAVLLISGTILITGEPGRSLMNVFFRTKLILLLAAAALTLALQSSFTEGRLRRLSPLVVTTLAATSILLWVAIIFCGRFIAYHGEITG